MISPTQQANNYYAIESSDGGSVSGIATLTDPAVVSVRSSLQVTSSGFPDRMKGVRIRATSQNPIYVLVVMKYNTMSLVGYSSYLACASK